MPSPIGHALAGVAAAWMADLVPGRRTCRTAPDRASWVARAGNGLTLICAGLAASPDLDLLFPGHRTSSHSIGALLMVGVIAAAIGAATRQPFRRVGLMCAAAYGSHLLLDWLGTDNTTPRGLQLFWPFARDWYISDWNVFRQTERQHLLTGEVIRTNVLAIAQELAIFVPMLAALWLIRVKALAGLATELPRRDHAPQ